MKQRIVIGALLVECNHFGGIPTDLNSFKRTQYITGQDVLEIADGTLGGYYDVLSPRAGDIEVIPTIAATACPGGPVTTRAYSAIKQQILTGISEAISEGPVAGVLLALHGAAAVDGIPDLEGDLLESVRDLIGADVALVATLDLHAYMTEQMVSNSDVLVAWDTYPHRDAFETGQRGATALLDIVDGNLIPCMAMGITPVLVGAINGTTEGEGPFADTMRLAKRIEKRDDVYMTSAFLVHPYLDAPNMGGGGLVITNDDPDLACELATEITEYYWSRRHDLEPELIGVESAIERSLAHDGSVVLVETSDCCGGGAAGDSVQLLPHLMALPADIHSVIPVVDAHVAAECHKHSVGDEIMIEIGFRHDPDWGDPVPVCGTIIQLNDGVFTYRGGIWDRCEGHMGSSAVIKVGGVHVCVATHPTYEWCGEQYDAFEIDVSQMKIIVAKNPMNYGMAFSDYSDLMMVLDTRGPTPATCRHLPFQRITRPAFPWQDDFDEHNKVLANC
ncbi:MAG: M81 family metallopeptidase [Pirellulales bacterium]|nr:M81 family metallopeptidase [Pirellulales bacterium]